MKAISRSLGLLACITLAGCDTRQAPDIGAGSGEPRVERRTMTQGGGTKQRQADFLNRIRSADPQHTTIQQAVINDQNELGLILNRTVQLDDIPTLMRGMLTQVAREFPGEDLTVIAYTPSNPPRKIGTARLDARTRDMTYAPEA